MFNIILTAALTAFLMLTGLLVAGFFIYRLAKARLRKLLVEFITSPDDKTASPLATLTGLIASQFGAEISQHLKAAFMGLQSVESKAERKAIAQAIIGKNNLLSALVESFPAVGKRLAKNPALAGLAQLVVDKVSAQTTDRQAAAPGPSVKFDF